MPWRGLIYLTLIAPLHYILLSLTVWGAYAVPDFGVLLHLIVFTGLFAILLWWALPALAALLSITAVTAAPQPFRRRAILAGVAWERLPIAAIMTGLTPLNEVIAQCTAALICTHTWLIRSDLRRKSTV